MNCDILVLYNLPSREPKFREACGESDDGVSNAVKHVVEALNVAGFHPRPAGIRMLEELPSVFAAGKEKTVFNLVERLDGSQQDVNAVPAVCRAFGRACTGGSFANLCLTFDKAGTKARLADHGVMTPPAAVIPMGAALPRALPKGPWIVKPLCAGGSEGIHSNSLINDRAGLASATALIHEQFEQPALIEKFIQGREFNLAVIERNGEPLALPVSEIDFSLFPPDRPHIVDYEIKWRPGTIAGQVSPRRIPADISSKLAADLRNVALCAWRACCCSDYARVDTRMDAKGNTHVLEVNANCDLSPLAGLSAALLAAGIPFSTFVADIVANAAARM